MNTIITILPYRYNGTWVFDDERVGLVREPFVSGVPEMIDAMVGQLPGAASGFRLLFSDAPFPGHQVELEWVREELEGNWYRWRERAMEGWLCPALFKYFAAAPARLYARMEPQAAPGGGEVLHVSRAEAQRLLELLRSGEVREAIELVELALG